MGATTSTATVSMTNREPRGDKHHVARVAVAANFGGVASGVILSSVAVEWLPRPTLTPYLCLILAAAVAVVLLVLTPRRYHGPHRPEVVRIERISVPTELRGPFWVSVGGLTSCYAIYGFFASLAPTAVREATRIPGFEAAAFVALMFGSAALVQIFLGQVRDRNALLFGLPLLVLALALFVVALPPGSVPLLIFGGILMGIAVGLVYMGSITLIDRVAPDNLRGEILSGFHLSGYVALAVPTLCPSLRGRQPRRSHVGRSVRSGARCLRVPDVRGDTTNPPAPGRRGKTDPPPCEFRPLALRERLRLYI